MRKPGTIENSTESRAKKFPDWTVLKLTEFPVNWMSRVPCTNLVSSACRLCLILPTLKYGYNTRRRYQ